IVTTNPVIVRTQPITCLATVMTATKDTTRAARELHLAQDQTKDTPNQKTATTTTVTPPGGGNPTTNKREWPPTRTPHTGRTTPNTGETGGCRRESK
ncbi:MAG: hypothetical protein AAFO96_28600, partial [Bacteroidota bacterium]